MPIQAPPRSAVFSRKDLIDLAGISDGVAAFWIRNGLLLATSGGEGRGSHRRFDRMQVTIAAILGELQKFGLNVRALSSFASILQAGAEHGQKIDVRTNLLHAVLTVARQLRRFRAGEEVSIYIVDKMDRSKPAISELEIAYDTGQMYPEYQNNPDELLLLADGVDPRQIEVLDIYADICDEMDTDQPQDGAALLLWQEGDKWQFDLSRAKESGFERAENIQSGIYLALSVIVRRVWSIDMAERELNRKRQREAFFQSLPPTEKRRLAKAWGREVE